MSPTPAERVRPGSTDRTRVRRLPELAVTDPQVLYDILDAGRVAHVATVDAEAQPYVVPVAYARMGDDVVFHGSTGSRLFRSLAEGQSTCLTVTLLDGLVVARSAFESSMNYRCAMVVGRARRLDGDDELDGLRVITEHLLPGRWQDCRHPSAKERAATMVLALSLAEASVKVRTGDPDDDAADVSDPVYGRIWAGHVPIGEQHFGPVASADCPAGIEPPDYVRSWARS